VYPSCVWGSTTLGCKPPASYRWDGVPQERRPYLPHQRGLQSTSSFLGTQTESQDLAMVPVEQRSTRWRRGVWVAEGRTVKTMEKPSSCTSSMRRRQTRMKRSEATLSRHVRMACRGGGQSARVTPPTVWSWTLSVHDAVCGRFWMSQCVCQPDAGSGRGSIRSSPAPHEVGHFLVLYWFSDAAQSSLIRENKRGRITCRLWIPQILKPDCGCQHSRVKARLSTPQDLAGSTRA
jgi:hypothetical protein